jgi:hypothetical protein
MLLVVMLAATVAVGESQKTGSISVTVRGLLFNEPKAGVWILLDPDGMVPPAPYSTNNAGQVSILKVPQGSIK